MRQTSTLVSAPWPAWTNDALVLYHGTVEPRALAIFAEGVDISKGSPYTDFGRGFYATTNEEAAREWAQRKAKRLEQVPATLRLSVDRVELAQLHSIVFVRSGTSAVDFWSFVNHCRLGHPHRPQTNDFYDVAQGPVAKTWLEVSNSGTFADYDQISFHTQAAQNMLNDRRHCSWERLP